MNLKILSDQALLESTEKAAFANRESLINLLHHLREVERRRLYSTLKCDSLFDYVVTKLKFSQDEASRRIKAMRLLRDVPEVEEKVTSGALTLSNLILAQTLFTKERKSGRALSVEKKVEVLSQLENQSVRSAQKIVCKINPEMKPKQNRLDFDSIEDSALREKLLRIKGLYAHVDPNISLTELLNKLCDEKLEQKTRSPAAPPVNSKAEIRRQVWRRDHGQCRNCGSTHALEIDHVIPQAVGGASTLENMRLLCRSCNQRAAIEYFGLGKMGKHLRSPSQSYGSPVQLKLIRIVSTG